MQDFCRAAYIAALNKLAESTTDKQLEQLWCIATKLILEREYNINSLMGLRKDGMNNDR